MSSANIQIFPSRYVYMLGKIALILCILISLLSSCNCQKFEGNETTREANLKTIGLIGGMSWYSTAEYYRIINEEVNKAEGGLHSAKIIMYSVDMDTVEKMQTEGRWNDATDMMVNCAKKLEKAGADCIVICTNTMHKTADAVQKNISIRLLNIIDITGENIKTNGFKKVGLLGTKYTMKDDFYKGRLSSKFGIEVIVPDDDNVTVVNDIIYEELLRGNINQTSKGKVIEIIKGLSDKGAEGVILGCTELPLLVKQKDVNIPLFNTTQLHAEYAAKFALQDVALGNGSLAGEEGFSG